MSELIRVSNLTKFQGFPQLGRKPVDNPAVLRASHIMRKGNGGGGIPAVQPPPRIKLFSLE
jgi:hypothetical protein